MTARSDRDRHSADDSRDLRHWLARRVGLVRLRQLADRVRHRLSFVPILYVFGAIALVQGLLWIDRQLSDESLPLWLETTVDSARSLFSAIAGGLITSTTLLLSMMLVAVQLASSQFSPRTMRDWLGNRTVQHAIGFVLGTTIFCLLALRSTRDFGEDDQAIVPHITVLVAVALGVLSLVAVVRTVDHITDSLRVESVSKRLTDSTIEIARRRHWESDEPTPNVGPESGAVTGDGELRVPMHATPIVAPESGWIQQIDESLLLDALPSGSTAYLTAHVGSFVVERGPMVWIAPPPTATDPWHGRVLEAIAVGDTRTMQHDVQFGIIQLTDIAVRALSPGINDPTTACEIVVHLGAVMTALWEQPASPTTTRAGHNTLVQYRRTHADHLRRAFDPILHYGADDTQVRITLEGTIRELRAEVERRALPGPVEPLDALLDDVAALDAR